MEYSNSGLVGRVSRARGTGYFLKKDPLFKLVFLIIFVRTSLVVPVSDSARDAYSRELLLALMFRQAS